MASRGIILGLRGVRDIIQMVGRFIRDCEGKSHADIYIVVDPPSEDEADIVEHLENNLSAIMIAMIAGWQYGPPRKPRSKADREANKILSNPEASDVVMRTIASAVARHAEGEPDQLKAWMHQSMRRLAEERPDLAALKTSAVRSRLVDNVNDRMSGPATEAEKKLKYKLPGLKGARELTGLKLTPEQSLARNITIMGFACGAPSMQMMRNRMNSACLDLTVDDVRAYLSTCHAQNQPIPTRKIDQTIFIGGSRYRIDSVDMHLRRRFGVSLAALKREICGNKYFSYDEFAEYIRSARIPGYDIRVRRQFYKAAQKGLLDRRCPRVPYKYYLRSGHWLGWPCKNSPPSGVAHRSAKLDDRKVRLIKTELANGASQASLASRFGVSPRTIGSIYRGESWRGVNGMPTL
jgi:transposase-like protein